MKNKHTKAEIEATKEELRAMLPPGSTVYTVLRHVSRSGMRRAIDAYALTAVNGKIEKSWLSRRVAAVCGYSFDDRREAVTVNGCGMDMGFDLVYNLSHALYDGDGKSDPGYTLRHEWL